MPKSVAGKLPDTKGRGNRGRKRSPKLQNDFAKEFARSLDPMKAAQAAGYKIPERVFDYFAQSENFQTEVAAELENYFKLWDAVPISAIKIRVLQLFLNDDTPDHVKISAAKLLVGTDWIKSMPMDTLGELMRTVSEWADADEDEPAEE